MANCSFSAISRKTESVANNLSIEVWVAINNALIPLEPEFGIYKKDLEPEILV